MKKRKSLLVKNSNILFVSIQKLCNIILESIISLFLPVLDVLASVINTMADTLIEESKIIIKTSKFIRNNAKKYAKISVILYQIILFGCECIWFYRIGQGKIEYTNFEVIISNTIMMLIYGIAFIVLMQKNYKNSNYSYVVYAQLLLFLPLIMVYWITFIEGKTIYLRDLNADQWIAIFNTVIIYFSACFIGLVGMYKAEKECNKQIKTK